MTASISDILLQWYDAHARDLPWRLAPGSALPGIDKGVLGMRVGGQRRLLVPPELVSGACREVQGAAVHHALNQVCKPSFL